MSIVRAVLGEAPLISIAAREGYIAVTPTGTGGPAGPASEWRFHEGYLQARPVDLSSGWANVIAVSAITGPMPDHSWSGTQLRFETEPGVWGSYVDLKGDAVEIGVSGGFIRWRPTGGSWTNIVELTTLVGADGPAVELQATLTHIQWRVVGDPTWINLVALADIKGDQGDPGPVGINLPLGPWDSGTAYVARDVVTLGGSSWICLVGHTNQSPPTLPTTSNTYWSLLAAKGDTGSVGTIYIADVTGLEDELASIRALAILGVA